MKVRVLCCLCLLASCLRAQTPEKKRPTIGLVLEGGGALGLAHIGLIQWFEQHHIPIDYIAGTSMGGLVGGFYASGMNGVEMHDVVRSLDWDQLVAGEPDYQKLSFRRKQDLRDIADGTVLGLKNKLVLPSGLNSGQGLDLLLSRIALPYAYLPSFADLPTPFRCVAADLTTAKAHVFEDGSFAEALRSTMSIPGLFEPVFDGNHEFVDGSILNNLPVDVVKQMGADIIIAVYLDTTPFDPKEPQSALAVLGRSLSAVTIANERHNMEMADMLISVDLHGIGTLNFAQFEDIIGRGSSGAEKRSRVLSKFALNDEDWQRYEEARASRRKTTYPVPQFVAIRGISGSLADTVQQYFVDLAGQPLQPEQVSDRIHKVMGTGAFSYMGYSMTRRGDENGLLIYVHPSPARPPTLQPALLLDGSDYKNTRFALAARLTAVNLGGFRSEWRTDFVVGSTYSVRSEWYHPWTAQSSWFIAPNAFASTRPLDFYHANQPRSLYRLREQGGGVDVGRMFGDVGELRVGYDSSYVVPSFNLGNVNAYPTTRGRYGDAHIQYTFDRVDDQIIPHSGVLARANFRLVDANPGLTKAAIPVLDGSAEWFRPTSYRGTLFTAIEGGGTLGKTNDGLPLFFLGGPQRLSAYGMNEYVGNNYVLGRVGWLRQLSPLVPVLDSRLYLLADYEVGRMFDARAGQTNTPMDANAGFIIRTVLGPLFLGGSVGDSSHRKIYFEMGRVF